MKRIVIENTRTMLGLTQQEISGILKISRSLWSNYEGLRRNLPQGVGLRLTEMLTYMLTPEAKALKALSKPEYQDKKTKMIAGKRLAENKFQLTAIARIIEKEEKNLEKYSKAVQLMEFLNSPEEVQKAANPEALSSITSNAIANFMETKSRLALLLIDQELLESEKSILEAAIELVDRKL